MRFDQYVFSEPYFGWLCQGVGFTLLITAITSILAVILGVAVVWLRLSQYRSLRLLGTIYVSFFRNLPPVPLLLFLVFGVPGVYTTITGQVFPRGMEFGLLVVGLSLNTAAYIAEILRSGIRAVAPNHYAAARVLGLGYIKAMRHVILPQALRVALPALGTRLIHNMKNSTVALVLPLPVTAMEVVGQAGRIAGQTFSWTEPLIFAAVVHLSLALFLGVVVNRAAKRAQKKVELTL